MSKNAIKQRRLTHHKHFISELLKKLGPDFEDYELLLSWYKKIGILYKTGWLSLEQRKTLLSIFHPVYQSSESLLGKCLSTYRDPLRNHLFLDSIYHHQTSTNQIFIKWDLFFQWTPAAQAIRKTQKYFHSLLAETNRESSPISLLMLGVDMARTLSNFYLLYPHSHIQTTFLSHDTEALSFAKKLLNGNRQLVQYLEQNILLPALDDSYDLIWGGLLPNICTSEVLQNLISRLSSEQKPKVRMVFTFLLPTHGTQHLLTFSGWNLYYPNSKVIKNLCQSILPMEYETHVWGNSTSGYGIVEIHSNTNSQPLISKS